MYPTNAVKRTVGGIPVEGIMVNKDCIRVTYVGPNRTFLTGNYEVTITPNFYYTVDKEEDNMGIKLDFKKESLTGYKVGDTITLEDAQGSRLVREVLSGETVKVRGDEQGGEETFVKYLTHHGWIVSNIKPLVKLPTEDGFYITPSNDVFERNEGIWFQGAERISEDHVKHDGGNDLQRLYTKKEIVDEIGEYLNSNYSGAAAGEVYRKFGGK